MWVEVLVIGIKLAFVLAVLLTTVPIMVYIERRGSALIQDRLGPNRVGLTFNTYYKDPSGHRTLFIVADSVKKHQSAYDKLVPLDEWTHLVGTFDSKKVTLYVNGA